MKVCFGSLGAWREGLDLFWGGRSIQEPIPEAPDILPLRNILANFKRIVIWTLNPKQTVNLLMVLGA